MFNNFNSNSQSNSVNVNTRLYTSYSDDSLLTLSAWNTNLSLKVQPAKGKNDDGLTIYGTDQTETVTASITPESNQVLLAGIDNEIIPALKESRPASIAIVTGATAEKRKIINVVTDGNKVGLTVVYGGSINYDGTSSGSSVIEHTFNERNYVNNYKKDAGGETKPVHSDFYAFIAKLNELKYVDGAISHGITYNNAVKSAYTSNKNSSQPTQNTYSAPVTNVGDGSIDDFIPLS